MERQVNGTITSINIFLGLNIVWSIQDSVNTQLNKNTWQRILDLDILMLKCYIF